MRIAVGGIHMECSTYNNVQATAVDFRVLRGAELLQHFYFSFLQNYHAEFLPVMHARAIAGGPITAQTYDNFKQELLEGFKKLFPLNGVYLAMHGAMFVAGMEDAEGDFISAVRDVVGPQCLIAVSYDLHGNISQRIIDNIDIFSTYRTAPHIDVEETMSRSVTMLVRAIAENIKPSVLWVPVPVVLPGEKTSTVDEPAKSLYAKLPLIEMAQGLWDASLQVGYVWADEPRATAAAIMTGTNRATMKSAALSLAQDYWNCRNAFAFGMPVGSIEECIVKAMHSATAPFIIAESGDNPTGGGAGDRAEMLAALLNAKVQNVIYAGIADAPATDQANSAGVGATISCSIGGTLDASSAPINVKGKVIYLLHCETPSEREAVLEIDGVKLVITTRRRPFHNISDFTRLGLDVHAAHIIVVKSGYLSPELAPLANPAMMALSAGAVDQYVERLPRLRKSTPTFPFDYDFEWSPVAYLSSRAEDVTC